jgi:type VI secretion system secreted protein Hcp
MAMDGFIKIDGIPGESTDEMFKDWIEVLYHNVGVAQSASAVVSTSGGATSGRASFQDFVITKLVDKASPKLWIACSDGTHIKEITLALCRASGSKKLKYMEIKMSNCIISSYNLVDGGDGSLPMEQFSINYGKMEMTYTQQKRADGSGGGNVAAAWDLQTNKRC